MFFTTQFWMLKALSLKFLSSEELLADSIIKKAYVYVRGSHHLWDRMSEQVWKARDFLFITILVRDNCGFYKYHLNYFQRNPLSGQGFSNRLHLFKVPPPLRITTMPSFQHTNHGDMKYNLVYMFIFVSTLCMRYLAVCHIHSLINWFTFIIILHLINNASCTPGHVLV